MSKLPEGLFPRTRGLFEGFKSDWNDAGNINSSTGRRAARVAVAVLHSAGMVTLPAAIFLDTVSAPLDLVESRRNSSN